LEALTYQPPPDGAPHWLALANRRCCCACMCKRCIRSWCW
jgi:hypothetical protein